MHRRVLLDEEGRIELGNDFMGLGYSEFVNEFLTRNEWVWKRFFDDFENDFLGQERS